MSEADLYPLGPALEFLQGLWRLNHAIERLSARMEKRLGLTAQQRLYLRCIGTYPSITSGHLATVLHLDPATVSAALLRLERRGLVERRKDPADHRRVVLGLSPKGRALDVPQVGTLEAAAQAVLEASPAEDVASTQAFLGRLARALEESIGPEPPSAPSPARTRARRRRH